MAFCALCGFSANLRSSHYLAAGFFRRLHGNDAGQVTPPILLNPRLIVYSCRQPQANLLCDDCEHRFKVGGEDWVIDCTARTDGSFPLRDLLLLHAPLGQVGPQKKAASLTFSPVFKYWQPNTTSCSTSPPACSGEVPYSTGRVFRTMPSLVSRPV